MKLARIVGEGDAVREFLDNDDWDGIDILGPPRWAPTGGPRCCAPRSTGRAT
ncbi:hypothetical protein G7085_20110 [Tessaracoccus sp. HDW20]|uniref:hypothetical protein n=1 Tax=Tessaracoccus coleopterorum TaxID=2714950 RepID=UPI0018D34BAF|nr:hypothetical protein [Tessaracoccus coleopterorum]NHB86057.1 hypothetical protein [Tessaracoccus coleopterorum]